MNDLLFEFPLLSWCWNRAERAVRRCGNLAALLGQLEAAAARFQWQLNRSTGPAFASVARRSAAAAI